MNIKNMKYKDIKKVKRIKKTAVGTYKIINNKLMKKKHAAE